MRCAFAVAIMLILNACASVAAGQLEDAASAYTKGDYATALRLSRPLAAQGDVRAEVLLGAMYDRGRGVAQDDAEAAKWYRLAADQGLDVAQLELGVMYNIGQGVPKDYVLAYMWLNLAATQEDKDAGGMRTISRGG